MAQGEPSSALSAQRATSSYPPHPLITTKIQTSPTAPSASPLSADEHLSPRKRAFSVFASGQKRIACSSCRAKKIRCDGHEPICGACIKGGWRCFFDKSVESGGTSIGSPTTPEISLQPLLKRIQSNNAPGTPCTSLMQPPILRPIDRTRQAPNTSELPGGALSKIEEASLKQRWRAERIASASHATPPTTKSTRPPFDFGLSRLKSTRSPRACPFLDHLKFETYYAHLQSYKAHVHAVLPFLNYKELVDMASFRFDKRPVFDPEMIDIFICLTKAIASAFHHKSESERWLDWKLVEGAKERMDAALEDNGPTSDLVAAWNLRTIALLMIRGLKAAWISSCTAVHVAEQACAEKTRLSNCGLAETEHIHWVTKFLNATIAVECDMRPLHFPLEMDSANGKDISKEVERNQDSLKTKVSQGTAGTDDPAQLLLLYFRIIESSLEHPNNTDPEILKQKLVQLAQIPSLPGLRSTLPTAIPAPIPTAMWRALFAFRLYRQLHLHNAALSAPFDEIVLSIGNQGVRALHAHLTEGPLEPWWHTPRFLHEFVYFCLFIGSNDSLIIVGDALRILERLEVSFPSEKMRALVENGRRLIRVLAGTRLRHSRILAGALAHADAYGEGNGTGIGVNKKGTPQEEQEEDLGGIQWTVQPDALIPTVTN